MKKTLSLVLVLAMLLVSAMAFADVEATVYPMTTDETLTMWIGSGLEMNDSYADYNEWPFFKYLEEASGVHVNYTAPVAGADATQAYNLLISTGDLPDIMYIGSLPNRCAELLEDEYIISLNDYMQYAPALSAICANDPLVEKSIKSDSGDFYAFPFLRENVAYLGTFVGVAVNTKLLDEAGLGIPETIADWETALYAIKDKCDVPLGGNSLGRLKGLFANAYGFNGMDNYYVEDGVVKTWMNADGYKDMMTMLSRWMADGIIDPDVITIDTNTFYTKMNSMVYGAAYYGSGSVQGFKEGVTTRDGGFYYVAAPYPVMNAGDEIRHIQGEAPWTGTGAVVTTACANPELAVRWLDFSYTDAGIDTWNYGKLGESYEIVDGKPAYTALITEANETMREATARYCGINGNGFSVMRVYFDQIRNPQDATDMVKVWTASTDTAVQYRMPAISSTAEESEELADIETSLTTYANEMFVKFLTDPASLDTYDEYLANLDKLNIARVLEIKQAQYDRFNAR